MLKTTILFILFFFTLPALNISFETIFAKSVPFKQNYDFMLIDIENEEFNVVEEFNTNNKQFECLSKNIYFESALESTAGKIAVGQVVINRRNSGRWPDTFCDVIYQGKHYFSKKRNKNFPLRNRCQFSWYCDGKIDEPPPGNLWNRSKEIAKILMKSPELVDITDGATFYHADYIDTPMWAFEKIKTVKIDKHIFYSTREI